MSDERTKRAEEAVNAILAPLGSHLRHYMPVHREDAIAAMRKVLADEREECAVIVEAYPPDGFFAALRQHTEYDEMEGHSLVGDTGNWAWLMGEVLKPYAAKIRAA